MVKSNFFELGAQNRFESNLVPCADDQATFDISFNIGTKEC